MATMDAMVLFLGIHGNTGSPCDHELPEACSFKWLANALA